MLKATTPLIVDQDNKSIAILEKLIIAGINQCICIQCTLWAIPGEVL